MSSSIMFYPLSSKLSNIISLVCRLYLCTMYIVHMWPSLIRLIHYFFIKALKKLLSAHLIVFIFAIGLSFIIYKQAFNVWSGKIHLNRFTFGLGLGHTSEQPCESIHQNGKTIFGDDKNQPASERELLYKFTSSSNCFSSKHE